VDRLLPPEVAPSPEASHEVVKRELVRNLWHKLFGTVPSSELVDELFNYFAFGGTCVLGETFHTLFFNQLLEPVARIRQAGFEAAWLTPTSATVQAECVGCVEFVVCVCVNQSLRTSPLEVAAMYTD